MAHSTRQLHFVVGTSLLTAALLVPSLGCSKNKCCVNEGPEPPADADAGSVEPDQPEPPEEPDHVNVGPQDEPETEPEPAPVPKHVNTQKVPDHR